MFAVGALACLQDFLVDSSFFIWLILLLLPHCGIRSLPHLEGEDFKEG